MPCTTILAGKKATHDNSTMIARTEDGPFEVKRMIVVTPDKQPKTYTTVRTKCVIELPEEPMRYTACPNVNIEEVGLWAATGINAANVGMTATETITSNPRVLAADPLVSVMNENGKEVPGGIGEEDIVTLTLPYIHSAREGVLRLGKLLETYGTYEMNGIAFNDENECWWLETIGGHHWMARRVKDEEVVIAPNQFAMDYFDFDDAYGEKKEFLCSDDLLDFMEVNQLNLNQDGIFNPRWCFGSRRDSDHIFNTPRAWYMGRYLTPFTHKWDGPNAEYTPESDNIPWSFVPDKKITPEDIKYLLSSYYQGTPYNPYSSQSAHAGQYRVIGTSKTGVMTICQIRSNMPEELKGVEWVAFASCAFNTMIPLYTNVNEVPAYLSEVTMDVSTENFFWASRLLGALADAQYTDCARMIENYQGATMAAGRRILFEYDQKMKKTGDYTLTAEANQKVTDMVKEKTTKVLNEVLLERCKGMKNGFRRVDN